MKEDYLWNKTGNDSEIENLENALKQFRSTNTIPPILPAKTFAFDKKSLQTEKPRFSFRLVFAAFACIGLMIISIGIFRFANTGDQEIVQLNSNQILNETNAERSISVPGTVSTTAIRKDEKNAVEPTIIKATFNPKKAIKKRIIKSAKRSKSTIIEESIVAENTKLKPINNDTKVEVTALTQEEKYAYDQLMTALAITSSKLKIVKDKSQGVEE